MNVTLAKSVKQSTSMQSAWLKSGRESFLKVQSMPNYEGAQLHLEAFSMAMLETSRPPEPVLHASLTLAGKPKEIDGPFILVSILEHPR